MKLIVDTNIVFSTLLNPYSAIGEILMNIQDEFTFFAPELLKEELKRYEPKIAAYSKLNPKSLSDIEALVLSTINFVSEELISEQSWVKAFALTKDIDEDDTPFIALGIELDAKLWTGDKILSKGLAKKGADIIITTTDLKKITK
ncbi:PIN domain-containing protein [uncultured Mucilaginibacter sp.]|uniref:PIN domain-containing protein n=1 Tax=uncultured Mucilaginibacter sp. TaxID=797541 RepID=UPI0025D7F88B|nr:PIN domain-containing protein [uncultured Mucilaginibacter sp.]